MLGCHLDLAQILADGSKITFEFPRMLHSVPSDLLYDGILFHLFTSNSSSGEQISGHSYPSSSTTCRTFFRVNGLFR
jgi:hypothetical protein